MRERRSPRLAGWAMAAMVILLAACSSHERPANLRSSPVRTLGSGYTNASVWRLRSGLNVAALSCRGRGRTSVSGAYRVLLSRHRELLASAYRAEESRLGQSRFDRQQTRVYNRFANQRSPQRFCETAARLANRANRMKSSALAGASRGMVSELEARLR